jgi:hypothetical protein
MSQSVRQAVRLWSPAPKSSEPAHSQRVGDNKDQAARLSYPKDENELNGHGGACFDVKSETMDQRAFDRQMKRGVPHRDLHKSESRKPNAPAWHTRNRASLPDAQNQTEKSCHRAAPVVIAMNSSSSLAKI